MCVAGFRGIGTTTLYLFRSVASWVVEKDYRASDRGTFWILFSRTCIYIGTPRVEHYYYYFCCCCRHLYIYYGKPIIKQISKTPRWKRKKGIRRRRWRRRRRLGGYRVVWWYYNMIIYVETSTEEEENIKKREITIFYERNRRVSRRGFLNNTPTRIFLSTRQFAAGIAKSEHYTKTQYIEPNWPIFD